MGIPGLVFVPSAAEKHTNLDFKSYESKDTYILLKSGTFVMSTR